MISHVSPVSGVACWQDQYVATAGYDNQVVLWDASTDVPLARAHHDHLANQCAFTPDGRFLLTASSDYSARVWTVPDLRLHAVLTDHRDDVEMVAPHPTLPLAATASRDHAVRVFDLSGRLQHVFHGHTADVISVEWTEQPDELVSSSDDATIRRWSLTTGGEVSQIDMGGVETDTVALDVDGTVYAGNDEGQLVVVRDGERTIVQAHNAGVKRLVLDAAGSRLVSLSYDRTAVLWDVGSSTPTEVSRFALPADVWPRSCAFADAHDIVFATFGDRYRRYSGEAGEWGPPASPTHGLNAVAVGVTPRGTDLVVGDAGLVWTRSRATGDRQLTTDLGSLCNFLTPVEGAVLTGGQLGRVMNALTGDLVHQHRSPLNCAAGFTRAGVPHAVVGTYTGEGLLLRREAGTWRFVRELPLLANAVKGLAASDRTLFAVGADCSATWWDLDSLTENRIDRAAHAKIANGCAWVVDEVFASVSRDLHLRLWDAGTPQALRTPHEHSVKCTAALQSVPGRHGPVIATGAYDGTVALLDVRTGTWLDYTRVTTSGVSTLVADPVEGVFLASSYDGQVHVVELPPETSRDAGALVGAAGLVRA